MPLDPSILLPNASLLQSIANPQPIPSYADIQAKNLALQNARLQAQGNVLDLQQKQRELDEHQQVIQALHDSGGDVDKAVDSLFAQGNSQAPILAKNRADMQKTVDEHQKSLLDNASHQADMLGRSANSVLNAPDEVKPIVYQGQKQFLEKNNLVPAGIQLPPQYTPDMLPQLQGMVARSQSVKDQAETVKNLSEGKKADVDTAAKQRADAINTLSAATDDNDFQTKLAGLKDRGIPAPVLKEFQGQTWTPQYGQQLTTLAVPAEQRATVAKASAEAEAALLANANRRLLNVAGKGPDAWKAALSQETPEVQKYYANVGPNPTLGAVLQAGMTGAQQIAAQQKQTELGYQGQTTAATALRAKIAAMTEGREATKQAAEIGSPTTAGSLADQVQQNPDLFHELQPGQKTAVSNELVRRGQPIPIPISTDLKNRESSAQLSNTLIQQIRDDMADPRLAAAIGPWAGRKGNLEQKLGTPILDSADPDLQSKEQRLRTNLGYLNVMELKALMGGRPSSHIFEALGQVSARPTMAMPYLNGALNAVQGMAGNVIGEAQSARYGGKKPGSSPAANGSTQQRSLDDIFGKK